MDIGYFSKDYGQNLCLFDRNHDWYWQILYLSLKLKNTEHQYTIDALAQSTHSDCNTTLLRSHKIYWDITRSTEISQDLLRSHKI